MESSVAQSPRPVPEFTPETPFSQRKKTPFRALRPPSATCPPVSRTLRGNLVDRPQLVSFISERNEDVMATPLYNHHSNESYFEQCFRVCEKLGEGSFGKVYRVCSREDDRMYAVKESRECFRGKSDRKLKLAEVEKHERLPHHPNCVKFHKAWEERQRLYIQIELCLMSLSEFADTHGKIPEYRIWHILVDLVNGLKHLHDHQLCHLDIKPANLFLANDEVTCKVGDFGLCVSVEQGFVDAVEGDPKYLAPELMKDQFGKPADIFSLGISLLELACDVELPSRGEGWHLVREGLIPQHVTKDLSPELVGILTKMMHPDPKLRPTVDEILAEVCASYHVRSNRDASKSLVRPSFTSERFRQDMYNNKSQCSNYKLCSWLFSSCKRWLCAFFMFFISLFLVKRDVDGSPVKRDVAAGSSSHGMAGSGKGRGTPPPHPPPPVSTDDDDDELFQSTLSAHMADYSVFNRSWIRTSPVKYPRVDAGPPIPLRMNLMKKY